MYNHHTHVSQACHSDIYVGAYIVRQLKDDKIFSADEEKFKLKYLWECLTDWKTYVSSRSSHPNLRSVIVMT